MPDSAVLKPFGSGEIEVGAELLYYFAQNGQNAAKGIKQAVDEAREDARKKQEVADKNQRIQRDLDSLLGKLPVDSKPANVLEIRRLLRDVADNPKLSSDQRRSAQQLFDQFLPFEPPRQGDYLNQSLPAERWGQLKALADKYSEGVGPLGENDRASIMAWIKNNSGEKHGKKFIGTEASEPPATAEDVGFLNDIRRYLNERGPGIPPMPEPVLDWKQVNAELRTLLTVHADSQKEQYIGKDESVRMVELQLALQNYNNAINGASSSAKSVHDTKKAITDRI